MNCPRINQNKPMLNDIKFFHLLFLVLWSATGFAVETEQGDFHICYFSLNNPKEYKTFKRYTRAANEQLKTEKTAEGKPLCSVSTSEHLPLNEDAEIAFENLVKSNKRCHGLVFSGHHAGRWAGERAGGGLSLDFIEKLSCKPEYKDFFKNINALWLQGCRTLGSADVIKKHTGSQTDRLVASLDHFVYDRIEDFQTTFPALLDNENPYTARFSRIFSGANMFGWNASAPGMDAKSENSLPRHIFNMSRFMNNNQDVKSSPSHIPTAGSMNTEEAGRFLIGVVGLLNENQLTCGGGEYGTQSWESHWGDHSLAKGLRALTQEEKEKQGKIQNFKCRLMNAGLLEEKPLQNLIDDILKDPSLIPHIYDSLYSTLKELKGKKPKLYNTLLAKLKNNEDVKSFLNSRIESPVTGPINKMYYLEGYKELFKQDTRKIDRFRKQILEESIAKYWEIEALSGNRIFEDTVMNYHKTLIKALGEHDILSADLNRSQQFLEKIFKSTPWDYQIKPAILDMVSQEGIKNSPQSVSLLRLGLKDPNWYVQERSINILEDISNSLRKSDLRDLLIDSLEHTQDQGVKIKSLNLATKTRTPEMVPVIAKALKDQSIQSVLFQSIEWGLSLDDRPGENTKEKETFQIDLLNALSQHEGFREKGVNIVRRLLNQTNSPDTRYEALEAGARLSNPEEVFRTLTNGIEDPDLSIQERALTLANESHKNQKLSHTQLKNLVDSALSQNNMNLKDYALYISKSLPPEDIASLFEKGWNDANGIVHHRARNIMFSKVPSELSLAKIGRMLKNPSTKYKKALRAFAQEIRNSDP